MRRSAFGNLIGRLTVFVYAYPIFCFFVFISVILMLLTIALYFGGLSFKWEKRFARMLIFSMVPVCVWMVYFYFPIFPPLLITLMLWLIYPISFFANKNKRRRLLEKQQSKIKGWTCENCKKFNEDVFLVCKQCNLPRDPAENKT